MLKLAKMVNYTGKFVLAPMVRVGDLPTRLVALESGADLVWGPEIIDKKILTCKRVENPQLKTVDFVVQGEKSNKKAAPESRVEFRTARYLEKGKLIFQMGTANPDLAVQAAKIVIDDVDGLDVNAGCPKHFSIHAGMGAALLKTPDLLCDILKRLVEEVGKPNEKPISVKIRILENEEETLKLVDRLLETGISNLTVHCRTRNMRNREAPIRDYIPAIVDRCRAKKVSCIVNGGIKGYADYKEIQKTYGEDVGAMVAEAAEQNPTVFSQNPYHWAKAAKCFDKYARQFGNFYINSKFCLARIVPGKAKIYQRLAKCKSPQSISECLALIDDEGKEIEDSKKRSLEEEDQPPVKKAKVEENPTQSVSEVLAA